MTSIVVFGWILVLVDAWAIWSTVELNGTAGIKFAGVIIGFLIPLAQMICTVTVLRDAGLLQQSRDIFNYFRRLLILLRISFLLSGAALTLWSICESLNFGKPGHWLFVNVGRLPANEFLGRLSAQGDIHFPLVLSTVLTAIQLILGYRLWFKSIFTRVADQSLATLNPGQEISGRGPINPYESPQTLLKGKSPTAVTSAYSQQWMAYSSLLTIITILGVPAFVFGAELVAHVVLTKKNTNTGPTDYFVLLFYIIAGPTALLPYALLQRYRPPAGAIAMIIASLLTVLIIFAERHAAIFIIFWISLPMFIFGRLLLVLRPKQSHGARQ